MASDNGPRRQAREAALQVLYAIDSGVDVDVERALAAYWSNLDGPAAGRPYGDQIVRGVTAKREAIDEALRGASSNWRLERMARIDRNLLRIGLWEMLHGGEVPPQVAIDEAVELARTFGAEGAYAFVNGILDKIAVPKKA
jgi:N utilization substance protein B